MTEFGSIPTNSAGPGGELGGTWASPTVDIAHGWTSGSVIYADGSGNLTQDNAGLWFDATNNRLHAGDMVIGAIDISSPAGVIAQEDYFNTTNYALIQIDSSDALSPGETYLNCATGAVTAIRVGNVNKLVAATNLNCYTKFYPSAPAGTAQSSAGLTASSGAPSNAQGANGDFYFRSDGGALTTIYHKRAGSWVGLI